MFKQNPVTVKSRTAEGTIAGRSWVIKGTASGQAKAASVAGAAVIGYCPDSAASADTNIAVWGNGSLVETLAKGTLEDGDWVVAYSETEVAPVGSDFNPADKDAVYYVGQVEEGAQVTTGNRVHVRINMLIEHHAE